MASQVEDGAEGLDTEALLRAALANPRDALVQAARLLDGRPTAADMAVAHQAIGIVLRDTGQTTEALRSLRRALRAARRSGDILREADVLATLGNTLVLHGRTAQGLDVLDQAAAMHRGPEKGRVLMRRGGVLGVVGDHVGAIRELGSAVTILRRSGDVLWESRALQNRGLSYLATGDVERADADFARAEELLVGLGQDFEAAIARHNRGLAAFRAGNLPEAIRHLGEAQDRYVALEMWMPDLAIDRADVFVAAGLVEEARDTLATAIARMERDRHQAAMLAETILAAARVAMATGDMTGARHSARRAKRMFRNQGRAHWMTRADLLLAEAALRSGDTHSAALRLARATAEDLAAARSPEAPAAHLVAARIALARGAVEEARPHLAAAASARKNGPALGQSAGWLASAIDADQRGETRAMLHACRRGIRALDEHLATLGATELKARATHHGSELVEMAQQHALGRRDARGLLMWTERWRGVSTAPVGDTRQRDPSVAGDLAALRELTRRIEQHLASGTSVTGLVRERSQLETRIRRASLSTSGDGDAALSPDSIGRTLDEHRSSGWTLVVLVHVGDDLYAVVQGAKAPRIHHVGPVAQALSELQFGLFSLRRLATDQVPRRAGGDLREVGRRLEHVLLGPAVQALDDQPIVICPPGEFVGAPWGLLPCLAPRPFSVTPSCSAFLRCTQRSEPKQRRVALIAGPNLRTGGAEVSALRRRYPGAQVLRSDSATAEAALDAMNGTWLTHIAAHGHFRSENPLFSSLEMFDGPLTVHDLARLDRAPHRLILSSCESGAALSVGSDEMLGLTSSLLSFGTCGVVAAVTVIHDEVSVDVSLALHDRLRRGDSLATALLRAREGAGSETERGTAASFLPVGA